MCACGVCCVCVVRVCVCVCGACVVRVGVCACVYGKRERMDATHAFALLGGINFAHISAHHSEQ